MRQWIIGLCLMCVTTALVGCQTPVGCRDCQGGRFKGILGSVRKPCASGNCGPMVARGGGCRDGNCGPIGSGLGQLHTHHAQQPEGPPGPPVGQYAYPYYTLRGPRDFLTNNPPSIGP